MIVRMRAGFVLLMLIGLAALTGCDPGTPPPGSGSGNPPQPTVPAPEKLQKPGNITEGDKKDVTRGAAYFAPQGGGGWMECEFGFLGDNFFYADEPPLGSPEVGTLCFKDVTGDNPELALYFPNGALAIESQPLQPANEGFEQDNDIPDLRAGLWLPAFLSDGPWRVVLTTDSETRELVFSLDQPVISVVTQEDGEIIHPFMKNTWDITNVLRSGDRLLLHGARFKPDTTIYLTVLRPIEVFEPNMVAVEKIEVQTDSEGRFWVYLAISDAYQTGEYYQVHYSDAGPDEMVHNQAITLFAVADAPYTWQPCADTYESFIHAGDSAYVDHPFSDVIDVYFEPGFGADRSGEIVGTTAVIVTGGPACADGAVWWYVEDPEGTFSGWIPEGDGELYWLSLGLG